MISLIKSVLFVNSVVELNGLRERDTSFPDVRNIPSDPLLLYGQYETSPSIQIPLSKTQSSGEEIYPLLVPILAGRGSYLRF
jgi:hypothetical protein